MDLIITLIQTHLHWENKKANMQMLEEKINGIATKTHVVVLPEMFTTGFSMRPTTFAETMEGATIQWMKKMAASKKIILTGSVIIEENRNHYNRLIWMLPNGQYGCYDKRHLFAYGQEHKHYTAGTQRLIAAVNGWKINLQVCYDLRFPVWARQQATTNQEQPIAPAEYDVLLYVANWPESRILAWETLLKARAIENQCYAIGLNRVGKDGNHIYHNGKSMVVDALGKVVYQKENEEHVATIHLSKDSLQQTRNKFPFLDDADAFNIR